MHPPARGDVRTPSNTGYSHLKRVRRRRIRIEWINMIRFLAVPQIILIALLTTLSSNAGAATPEATTFAPDLEVVDVPTASTLYARMFHLNFRTFPEMAPGETGSGILLKGMASFNNSLSLGLAIKASNIIGSGSIRFEEDEDPIAAVAKLKILSLPGASIQAALGYDGMGYDVTRKKGLYLVASKDMSAGLFFFRAHLGLGAVRLRQFNVNDDLNLFFGLNAALSEELFLGFEYDDVLYKDDPNDSSSRGSANAMIGYAWDVGLRLEIGFKRLFRGVDKHYRVLKILYTF